MKPQPRLGLLERSGRDSNLSHLLVHEHWLVGFLKPAAVAIIAVIAVMLPTLSFSAEMPQAVWVLYVQIAAGTGKTRDSSVLLLPPLISADGGGQITRRTYGGARLSLSNP